MSFEFSRRVQLSCLFVGVCRGFRVSTVLLAMLCLLWHAFPPSRTGSVAAAQTRQCRASVRSAAPTRRSRSHGARACKSPSVLRYSVLHVPSSRADRPTSGRSSAARAWTSVRTRRTKTENREHIGHVMQICTLSKITDCQNGAFPAAKGTPAALYSRSHSFCSRCLERFAWYFCVFRINLIDL